MYSELGSALDRGSILVVMLMPLCRAPGGRNDRKRRAAFACGEKGLNRVVTSVMNRVIILADRTLLLLSVRLFGAAFSRFRSTRSGGKVVWQQGSS